MQKNAHAVLTFEGASDKGVANVVGQAGADGAVVDHAAFSVEAAHPRARVDTLVPRVIGRVGQGRFFNS